MDSVSLKTSHESSIHACISRPATVTTRPLVVFLHYWGGSSSTWYKLTSPDTSTSLSNVYPTVAVDLRGWGKSTGPSHENGSAYSVSAMASDIASLLEQLKADESKEEFIAHGFILVGHSMGAKVAFATLPTLSTDLLQQVKGLVLVAPAPPTALDLPAEMKSQQEVAYETEESVLWTVKNVLANPDNLSEKDVELVLHDSLQGNALAKRAWPTYGMQEDISHELRKTLASMRQTAVRASIIVGELDIVEPKERVDAEVRHFLEENGFQVSLTTLKNVKHLIPLEDAGAIYREINRF